MVAASNPSYGDEVRPIPRSVIPPSGSPLRIIPYTLLNDEPVQGGRAKGGPGGHQDLLGARKAALRLAQLIHESRSATPFTISVDGGWGSGKSSLMHLTEAELRARPRTECVWFNAWTSHGADALEGLLKSVLLRFDRNALRRAVNRVREHRTVLRLLRSAVTLLFGVVHAGRIVDELWSRMEADAAARNQARQVIKDVATEWAESPTGRLEDRRLLVVFVDDLDRCPDETVHAVCEAIKLYLDVPGMVFVLGCDQSRLAAPGSAASGGQPVSAEYLEKIVQISYRVPTPSLKQAASLVMAYADHSGVSYFRAISAELASLIADRTGRNPRRIKRLINSFVMHQLDPDWTQLGPEAVIRAVLMQHLYPDFYRAATRPTGPDLVNDFTAYYEARGMLRRHAASHDDPRWEPLDTLASRLLLPEPDRRLTRGWDGYLDLLESQLPPVFPTLAADPDFVDLITEINSLPQAEQIHTMMRRGAPTASLPPPPPPVNLPLWNQESGLPWLTRPAPLHPADSDPVEGLVGAEPPSSVPAAPTGSSEPGPSPYGNAYPQPKQDSYAYPQQNSLTARTPVPRNRNVEEFQGLRILWVDETPASVRSIANELRHLGADVHVVTTTQQASEVLRSMQPHVVLSDVRQGGDPIAGFEGVTQLRDRTGYDGPAIFYPGRAASDEYRQRAREAGGWLVSSVERLLERLAEIRNEAVPHSSR